MTIKFTVFRGSPNGDIVQTETVLPDLNSNEVLLRHTHSGVCGTDLHFRHSDIVLGHEGVGVVEAIGDGVKRFKVGDRLGFGFVRDGCGVCKFCEQGYHWHCTNTPRIYGGTDSDQGSFATKSVWPDTRLVRIPDDMSSEDAGPFMCAGQTVFVPMLRTGIKSTDRVGVVGIGGLGHLAIQFAAGFGAQVVALSNSDNKKQEAFSFGASEFHSAVNSDAAAKIEKLDHLIVTTSVQPDWDLYAQLMAPFGHIYALTVSGGTLDFPYNKLLEKELSIHGSCSSTMAEVEKMMDFVVSHRIKPAVEKFPFSMNGINQAFEKLEKGTIRYRAVLEA